eukprot:scaffold41733_cov55-Phaeocystis_antarctica.AAC.1
MVLGDPFNTPPGSSPSARPKRCETLELDPLLATSSADHGTATAPTQSSTQKAVSHLSRWAPLNLVT